VSLTFGLTIVVFGRAMLASARYSTWLASLGLAGGAATVAAGMAQASTGFSSLSMTLSMPASVMLLVWAIVVGAVMWRDARSL